MKTSIVIGLAILIFGGANAQKLNEGQVPEAVKKAFMQKFATAKEVKWSKENDNEFEAEFETGQREQAANFDNTGKWLVTEIEIKKSELPQAVQAALAKEFTGYKIEEAEKAESAEKGVYYELELKSGKTKQEVQFTTDGKLIKKEEIKSKKEND